MPALTGVLETSLYVADLDSSARFYRELFGLEPLFTDQRLCALGVAGKQVLLLFKKGASSAAVPLNDGVLPGHDGDGRLHLAFAIPAAERAAWERRLAEYGVALESTITWPAGGVSLYFRDPDGHLLELATPGIWAIY
jgi:catechol 2,3-dioxygenase-like lactoylglutathione lyase family enzyme